MGTADLHICDTCDKSPREMFYYRDKDKSFFKYFCGSHVPEKTKNNFIVEIVNRPISLIWR